MTAPAGLWNGKPASDVEACPVCGATTCEDPTHIPSAQGEKAPRAQATCAHALDNLAVCTLCGLAFGLDADGLEDAAAVAAQGRAIEEAGIRYVVDGIVPAYGMLGMLVAFAKVGKTTLGHALGASVSQGAPFLGRTTERCRVLYIAAEDPPEYTAYLARNLSTEPESMTFYRRGVLLNDIGLAAIAATVRAGAYGLVLIASWQAVVRGLVRDENDNVGAVVVVERVKVATRETGIPWLIDAHSGKGENQKDDADPIQALRGASAAAAAADYILSLRYANGAFGTQRRLSGRGRFVTLPTQTISYDPAAGTYESLGATKDTGAETTWRLIQEMGAVTAEPRSASVIARAAGLVTEGKQVSGATRKHVQDALRGREGVTRTSGMIRGQKTTLYSYTEDPQ